MNPEREGYAGVSAAPVVTARIRRARQSDDSRAFS